ncbi:sigma-70 family RNA polymerase sigma factor [Acinetobacter sp. WZC-1]|uniref:sigma-70 family RNA polymerase sigma factor n=1 Tax=Acinetobacter sp. WZC-1 TaxID=3459034 RepID=UPI00403DDE71
MNTAIQRLYVEHHSWLHGWLKQRLNNNQTAADLAHDTFVRILQRKEHLYFDQPRALLTTIARGVLVNWFQRQAVERAYLQSLALQPEEYMPPPEQQLQTIESLVLIFQMLEGMPERQRQTFIWSQLDGLSQKEIAQRHQVSVRTVMRDLSCALAHCLSEIDLEI